MLSAALSALCFCLQDACQCLSHSSPLLGEQGMDGDQAPREEKRHLADNSLLLPIGVSNMFLTCKSRLKVDCTELCVFKYSY